MDIFQRIIVAAPVFLLAIILHEIAHGYVAYLLGDDTAKLSGRLTMNPIAHIDPLGAIMFIVSAFYGIGFGWAKPVPVNTLRLHPYRLGQVLVSIAGVATNFAQAVIWSLLVRALLPHADASSFMEAAIRFCEIGVSVNIVLFIFNLLPIPPLDGFHVVTAAFRISHSTRVLRLEQMGFFLLFLLLWTGIVGRIIEVAYGPLYDFLLRGI